MRFSIVVPALNSASELKFSIPALKTAAASGDDILVVDDGSTDGTANVAAALGVRVLGLMPTAGPAEARNRGAESVDGDVLLFVDADVVVKTDVVNRIRGILLNEPDVAAVFGSYDAFPPARGVVSRYRNLLHHFTHQQGNREATTFWAGLGAVRRAVFLDVGGFDAARFPQPSIEDIELGYRLRQAGHRIRLDPSLQGTHLKAWTFWSMIRTDIARRGLPWARLILQTQSTVQDLNLRPSQRWSAVLLALALVVAAIALVSSAPWLWGLALAALVSVFVLNWRFYELLWRQGGPPLALGSVPLHSLYFLYGGLGFLYVWVEWRLRRAAGLHKRPRSTQTL
jgi:GT2 family glycosyltransferase